MHPYQQLADPRMRAESESLKITFRMFSVGWTVDSGHHWPKLFAVH